MPFYDYKCKNDHEHTENRSIHAEQVQMECRICAEPLQQVYTVPSVALIGRGFYSNGG